MTVPEISSQVAEFLERRLLGRFATSSLDGQPHVVPVWFLWEDNAVWISSYRSTRKVYDIEANQKCALVIDIEDENAAISAVVLEARAELISNPADLVKERIERVYIKYLGRDGVAEKDPQSWLNSSENVLIKLTPTRIKTW